MYILPRNQLEYRDFVIARVCTKTVDFYLDIWDNSLNLSTDGDTKVEIESKYKGYLDKQQKDIDDFKKDEQLISTYHIFLL